MVRINGEELDTAGKTVAQLLSESGYDVRRVAVELNEDILPKSKFDSTVIQNGDSVEIVSFVGGG